jgi:O-Antigen ligase
VDLATSNASHPISVPGNSATVSGRRGKSQVSGRELLTDQFVIWAIASSTFFLVFFGNPGDNRWRRHPFFSLVDIFAVLLAGLGALDALRALRAGRRLPSTPVARALVVVLGALLVSFAVHPSVMGVATLLHFSAVVTIARQIEQRPQILRPVILTVLSIASFEAIIATGQFVADRALGLQFLGEVLDPFFTFGEGSTMAKIPAGTMFHPYPLVGLCLLAVAVGAAAVMRNLIKPLLAIFTAGMCGVMVGLSASVTAALTAGALSVVLAVVSGIALVKYRAKRPVAAVLVAFLLGISVAVPAASLGWHFKSERTSQGVETAGNGRIALLRQAGEMFRRWPATGVGPGRYMAERDAHKDIAVIASEPQPVHNFFALVIVESGVLGALGLLYLALQMFGALRKDWKVALLIMASLSGNLMFDHYLWLFTAGSVQLGIAFGLIGALCLRPAAVADPAPIAAAPGADVSPA